MKNLFFITATFFLLIGCSSNETCKDCELKNQNDSIPDKDTMPSLEEALKNDKPINNTADAKEIHEKIVKKYGEQWDFCTCVHANDSINNAFEKKLTPKQEEKLMARWEYVDVKCKEFLTNPNTTPEERAAHEKKVKKCLKNK